MEDRLHITDVTLADSNTCAVSFDSTFAYLFDDSVLRTTYDRDLTDVPDSILVIPAVANLAPLAWERNATVLVPELDRTFYYALPHCKPRGRKPPSISRRPALSALARSLRTTRL